MSRRRRRWVRVSVERSVRQVDVFRLQHHPEKCQKYNRRAININAALFGTRVTMGQSSRQQRTVFQNESIIPPLSVVPPSL